MFKDAVAKIWQILPQSARVGLTRILQPKFTISVAALIVNANGEILILDHYLRPSKTWGLPGGFIDHSEQPAAALHREILEETGVEISNEKLVQIRTVGKHFEMIFTAFAPKGGGKVLSGEIRDLGWFALNELPENMPDIQKQMVRSFYSGAFPNQIDKSNGGT